MSENENEIPPFLDRRSQGDAPPFDVDDKPRDLVAEVVGLMKFRDDCAADIQKIRKSIKKEDRKEFDAACDAAYAERQKAAEIARLEADIAKLKAA